MKKSTAIMVKTGAAYLSALIFVFIGAWQIYPPAAFITVGALIWIELFIWSIRR